MSDELQILRDLRDLLEPPQNWIKGAYARDEHGFLAGSTHPLATCWCLSGAVTRVAPSHQVVARIYRLLARRGFVSLPEFNDHPDTTHSDVLELLDEAIAEVIAERTAKP